MFAPVLHHLFSKPALTAPLGPAVHLLGDASAERPAIQVFGEDKKCRAGTFNQRCVLDRNGAEGSRNQKGR